MEFTIQAKSAKVVFVVAMCAFSVASFAQDRPARGEGRPKSPPPEAIEACSGKAEGDTVNFETRRGDDLAGTCRLIDEQLVAVPNDHPIN
jgi:hypothetical protein